MDREIESWDRSRNGERAEETFVSSSVFIDRHLFSCAEGDRVSLRTADWG